MQPASQLNPTPVVDADILKDFPIQELFQDTAYRFDLREGTVVSSADTRMIYLSSDIVRGIHEALHYEAGDAWHIILKNAGYLWGKRLVSDLEKDMQMSSNLPLPKLPVNHFLQVIERYFSSHGWGKLKIYLDDAVQHGVIHVTMTHSLFASALNHVDARVDAMIEGMLRGIFEIISGKDVDCVEIVCARQSASPACQFVISGAERIENIEALIEDRVEPTAIIEQLRAM